MNKISRAPQNLYFMKKSVLIERYCKFKEFRALVALSYDVRLCYFAQHLELTYKY